MKSHNLAQLEMIGASKRALELLLNGPTAQAEIVEVSSGYYISVDYGINKKAQLVTSRGDIRLFRKIDTAMAFLKSIGCSICSIKATNFQESESVHEV